MYTAIKIISIDRLNQKQRRSSILFSLLIGQVVLLTWHQCYWQARASSFSIYDTPKGKWKY